jgi:hypothetical protein
MAVAGANRTFLCGLLVWRGRESTRRLEGVSILAFGE